MTSGSHSLPNMNISAICGIHPFDLFVKWLSDTPHKTGSCHCFLVVHQTMMVKSTISEVSSHFDQRRRTNYVDTRLWSSFQLASFHSAERCCLGCWRRKIINILKYFIYIISIAIFPTYCFSFVTMNIHMYLYFIIQVKPSLPCYQKLNQPDKSLIRLELFRMCASSTIKVRQIRLSTESKYSRLLNSSQALFCIYV